MALAVSPGVNIHPSGEQVALSTNYITNFDFLSHELPDVYEKEFERYGNRTVASFLRNTSSELPFTSDLVKWTEQGRLHTKYALCTTDAIAAADTATITVNDVITGNIAIRVGQTVLLTSTGAENRALVTAVTATTFDVAFYEAGGQAVSVTANAITVFITGSEFAKGANGMQGSIEAQTLYFDNKPIILKDKYAVNGSDMAQIGWVEGTSEDGSASYLWYLKSQHESRLRFEDYLETSMIEAVPAEAGSGVIAQTNDQLGTTGTDGLFYVVGSRGNLWTGGNPTTLPDFDEIIARLDKQGAIAENVLFTSRGFGADIDDMLATLNGYNGTGAANAASFGMFENDANMALNLGFTGFHRSNYDFYKTSWKYLNDASTRGGLVGGGVDGMLAPAGSTTVYDQVLGQNAKRPFLHVRYRQSQTENRKLKSWITGSAGGANNSDLDAMEVQWLSERLLCTLGANNFIKFNS